MKEDQPECQKEGIGGSPIHPYSSALSKAGSWGQQRDGIGGSPKNLIIKKPKEDNFKAVKVALLNAHSINSIKENPKENQRYVSISNLIGNNNLDVFLITETWLKFVTGDDDICRALPETFGFWHEPRLEKRGGGVAITFRKTFTNEKVTLGRKKYSTFEHVAATLQDHEWEKPVLFINVYRTERINWDEIVRTTTKFQTFINEFQELLNMTDSYEKIIVTGDFNVWYDDDKVKRTRDFKAFLCGNGLVQLVPSKTHNKGHILDLVITRNVNIFDLSVENEEMSDHFTVYFSVPGEEKKILKAETFD